MKRERSYLRYLAQFAKPSLLFGAVAVLTSCRDDVWMESSGPTCSNASVANPDDNAIPDATPTTQPATPQYSIFGTYSGDVRATYEHRGGCYSGTTTVVISDSFIIWNNREYDSVGQSFTTYYPNSDVVKSAIVVKLLDISESAAHLELGSTGNESYSYTGLALTLSANGSVNFDEHISGNSAGVTFDGGCSGTLARNAP